MNDETRKLLTEYMGECWHEWRGGVSEDQRSMTSITCRKCKVMKGMHYCRTFTTPDDMMALKDRLVEKGEWGDFYLWAALKEDAPIKEPNYVDWLLNAPRFCELVGEFIMSTKSENAEMI